MPAACMWQEALAAPAPDDDKDAHNVGVESLLASPVEPFVCK